MDENPCKAPAPHVHRPIAIALLWSKRFWWFVAAVGTLGILSQLFLAWLRSLDDYAATLTPADIAVQEAMSWKVAALCAILLLLSGLRLRSIGRTASSDDSA